MFYVTCKLSTLNLKVILLKKIYVKVIIRPCWTRVQRGASKHTRLHSSFLSFFLLYYLTPYEDIEAKMKASGSHQLDMELVLGRNRYGTASCRLAARQLSVQKPGILLHLCQTSRLLYQPTLPPHAPLPSVSFHICAGQRGRTQPNEQLTIAPFVTRDVTSAGAKPARVTKACGRHPDALSQSIAFSSLCRLTLRRPLHPPTRVNKGSARTAGRRIGHPKSRHS